jgi:HK97 family phage major capsid protein
VRTIEEIMAAMTAVVDGAPDRDLTDDEITQYETLEAELRGAQRNQVIRERHAAYNVVRTPAGVPAARAGGTETVDQAFTAFLRTGQPNQDIAHLQSRGRDAVPMNAQSEGTPSAGGYLVPDGFRTKLVERMKAYGGIANLAEEFNTTTGNSVEWPTVDDTANSGEIVAEAGTFASGADITFGTADLGAYKYMSGGASNLPVRVSVELLQDAAFDVEGLVSRLLGIRIGRVQASHLATGSGVGQPLGLVTGLTPVQNAANTALTVDDLITAIHSVDPAYRGNAQWVFNDNTAAVIEKLKDSNGDLLWLRSGVQADLTASPEGTQGRLLRYPVTIDQQMPDLDVDDSTDHFAAFGDIKAGYVIRRVRDVTVFVDPYGRAANGQVQYHAWARMDATQQDTNAYVVLSGKS